MSRLPWIVGGGAVAAYLWTRDREPIRRIAAPAAVTGQWRWPVPSWHGRAPVISDGFGSPRPGGAMHGGVDLMYLRLPTDAAFKNGSSNGSKLHVMPDGVPAIAASDGRIWSAMKTPRGFTVVIDHGRRGDLKLATYYTHLESLLVRATAPHETGELVTAGQPLGMIGFDPNDRQKLKHLHFELWLGGPADRVDPASAMRGWGVTTASVETRVARNGQTAYRPLGSSGERYPQWVRDLKGRSGVYLIRDADTSELLYVGSSSNRLYETLTRHFQTWRRFKGFWKGQYAEGHDPGLTYDRASVEVAIHFTAASDSLDEEARLIHRLRPRDNLLGQPAEDEVPF